MVSQIKLPKLQLIITYPVVDYLDWKYLNNGLQDVDAELNNLLGKLNLRERAAQSKNYKGLTTTPESFTYKNYLNNFYWYLLHITNPFEYNRYLDKLITIHEDNLKYLEESTTPEVKERAVKKKKCTNRFYREIKVDMFTNKEVYTYYNPKTGEEVISEDPNLLEELNAKKRAKSAAEKANKTNERKKVYASVDLSNMTFNFKKKI